jgi:hypothetical protein
LESWSTRHVHLLEMKEHCSRSIVLQGGHGCISMRYNQGGGQTCVLPTAVRSKQTKARRAVRGPGGRRESTGSPSPHPQFSLTFTLSHNHTLKQTHIYIHTHSPEIRLTVTSHTLTQLHSHTQSLILVLTLPLTHSLNHCHMHTNTFSHTFSGTPSHHHQPSLSLCVVAATGLTGSQLMQAHSRHTWQALKPSLLHN